MRVLAIISSKTAWQLNLRHPSGTATAQCACGFGVKVPRVGGLASEAKKLTGEGRNFSICERRLLPRVSHQNSVTFRYHHGARAAWFVLIGLTKITGKWSIMAVGLAIFLYRSNRCISQVLRDALF
jgi:hypothetical protein